MRDSAILDYLTTTTWAMEPQVLERLAAVLARHVSGLKIGAEELAILTAAKREKGSDGRAYRVEGRTAVIPVSGIIAKHAREVNGVSQPRGTSIEDLGAMLDEALADEGVERLLLHIESPGGALAGLPDFADAVRAAGRSKPITAFADDQAASAAYWIGAQAGRFYANQSAKIGSIGVYTVLVDSTRAAEQEGLKFIIVRSGEMKGLGEDGVPVSDGQVAHVREIIGAYQEQFLAAVAAGRARAGLTLAVLRPLADGRLWLAAEAAELKLIDGVATFAEALRLAGRTPLLEPEQRRPTMTEQELKAMETAAADHARKAARQEAAERLAALKAAFPDDPAFALEAASADLSVEAAKAKAYDRLKAAHAEALAAKDAAAQVVADENATLKKLLGSKGLSAADIAAFDPSDRQAPEPKKAEAGAVGADDGKAGTYQAAVDAKVKAGASKSEAHLAAATALPRSFDAWTKANQPTS